MTVREQLLKLQAQARAKAEAWEKLAQQSLGTKCEASCRSEAQEFRELEAMYSELLPSTPVRASSQ